MVVVCGGVVTKICKNLAEYLHLNATRKIVSGWSLHLFIAFIYSFIIIIKDKIVFDPTRFPDSYMDISLKLMFFEQKKISKLV